MKLDTILERIQTAKDNQQSKFTEFNDCDDLYNSQVKTQPGVAQVFNPRGWSAVESLVPRMVAKNPTVDYAPREESDADKAKMCTALFAYWWDKSDGFMKLVEWVKTSAIYGTGIAKVIWSTKKRMVRQYILDETGQPIVGPDGNYVVEEEKVTYYDDPEFKIVNNYKFFKNPGATDVSDAQWLAETYTKPLSDLEKENEETGIYKNLNKLKKLIAEKEDDTYDDHRHEATGEGTEQEDSTVEKVNLIEMWDMIEGKQYIVAAGGIMILERENPYWHGRSPYIKLVDSIVPFEWYGQGELAQIKGLQHALNTVRNARLDNVIQSINSMWKIKGEVDESELVWQPNGAIHVSDFDDAELVEYPDVTQNSYQEETFITGEIDHALGTADYTKIGDSNSDRTATGMGIKAEQLNSRFFHKIQIMEQTGLKYLGEIVLALYQQYITSERVIRIIGDNGQMWQSVAPQDIAGEYDCIVEAGSTQPVDKEREKEESVNLLQILGQDPDLKPEGKYELKTKLLEKFGYKKAKDMVYNPEEQMQAQMMMMQEQQSQMEAQAGQEAEKSIMDHNLEMSKLNRQGEIAGEQAKLKPRK